MDMFDELVNCLLSDSIEEKHRGIIGFRKICSNEQSPPPIQQIVDRGLMTVFIEMMKQKMYPQLKLEATWVITNVATGSTSQCEQIIEKGSLELFIKILN